MQIALAAVQLAHDGDHVDADEEIPVAVARTDRLDGKKPKGKGDSRHDLGETARVFVSLGHAAKIRPQDLVGAIANETSLSGRQIGAIEITHKFSIVEIPKAAVDEVIAALQATLIKGRKARVELYRPRA
jgi:ATP-dependent RNA helicase DeaD